MIIDQWASNFRTKFVQNVEYIDHYFNTPLDFSNIAAISNYESYGYESINQKCTTFVIIKHT